MHIYSGNASPQAARNAVDLISEDMINGNT